MNVTILDCDQRSDEWRRARVGRVTGSRAGDVLAMLKNGSEAAARRDYRLQLVTERLVGEPQDSELFVNDDMRRGLELEADAFAAYEALTGQLATRVGFIAHNTLMIGASPDGLIDDNGILELKVPRSATHLRYIRANVMPTDHLPQLLHNLYVTGARYADFMSFDPRFPAPLQTFYVRIERQEDQIRDYERKLLAFLAEIEAEVEEVQQLMDRKVVLT